jgi:hypothetical protein
VSTAIKFIYKSDAQLNQVSDRLEQIIEKKDNNIDGTWFIGKC